MQVKVQGAALHPQTLRDAPASVTIITAEEIIKYGYRTLGEALASVRGFYLDNNRTYETVGVRGFAAPGDYASRILVMVNGHSMSDNIWGYMLFFGNDFPIDMNLIRQIEIIRGPSSALYGTNGMFATINIVTKTPDEAGPASLTTTFDSFGEKKGQIMAAASLGANAKALFSGSVYNNSGESPLYFPEFAVPQANNGYAVNMDGEKGYHLFSNLTWGNWSVIAAFSGHDKIQPISWGPTIFNDRGTKNIDIRDYVEVVYAQQFARGTLRWRTYYDAHDNDGFYDYPLDADNPYGPPVNKVHQTFDGRWVGSELTYRMGAGVLGTITAGAEAKWDLLTKLTDDNISPVQYQDLNIDPTDRNLAVFVQDERKLSHGWTLDLGAREDRSAYLHDFFSPRAALIYQPHSAWTYKFLYGRSFRNPSAFELYFDDGTSSMSNHALRPEEANTVEFDAERKIAKHLNLLTAAYGYSLHNYIEAGTSSSGLIQYHNVSGIRAGGIEVELNGRPKPWLEFTASYAIQRSKDLGDSGVLENSPEHLGKLHFAVPLGRKFEFSSGLQYTAAVVSLAQQRVSPVFLADFTLISRKLSPNFDFTLGVRNALNRSYSVPIALNPMVDTMPQPGRSIFFELIPHRAR